LGKTKNELGKTKWWQLLKNKEERGKKGRKGKEKERKWDIKE
jgi:hypothetical protein